MRQSWRLALPGYEPFVRGSKIQPQRISSAPFAGDPLLAVKASFLGDSRAGGAPRVYVRWRKASAAPQMSLRVLFSARIRRLLRMPLLV